MFEPVVIVKSSALRMSIPPSVVSISIVLDFSVIWASNSVHSPWLVQACWSSAVLPVRTTDAQAATSFATQDLRILAIPGTKSHTCTLPTTTASQAALFTPASCDAVHSFMCVGAQRLPMTKDVSRASSVMSPTVVVMSTPVPATTSTDPSDDVIEMPSAESIVIPPDCGVHALPLAMHAVSESASIGCPAESAHAPPVDVSEISSAAVMVVERPETRSIDPADETTRTPSSPDTVAVMLASITRLF